VDAVIRIGVLTPHAVAGPELEFAAMAPGRLLTRVARVTGTAGAGGSGGPTSPADLAALATAPFPDRAAGQLLTSPVDVIGYASTTSNQVLLWQLLAHADDAFEISGYGGLFARKP